MDWKAKMKDGMKMIRDACEENYDWNNCSKCPFENLCDAIVGSEYNKEKDMEWDMAVIIGNEIMDKEEEIKNENKYS